MIEDPHLPDGYTLHRSDLPSMPALTWHEISTLRQDVFVVEQDCAYPDQEARDARTDTVHLWLAHRTSGAPDTEMPHVAATLRILTEPDGVTRRIGRVATARAHRGQGLMGALMWTAVALCDGPPIVLDAQAHLRSWYQSFGFVQDGTEFLEDGIPHVPMRLTPA